MNGNDAAVAVRSVIDVPEDRGSLPVINPDVYAEVGGRRQ